MKSLSSILNPSPISQLLWKLFPFSFYHSGNILCSYVNFISGIIFGYIDVLPFHVVIFMNLFLTLFLVSYLARLFIPQGYKFLPPSYKFLIVLVITFGFYSIWD